MHELWAPACGTRPDHPTPSMQQREDAVSPCTREHRVRSGGGGDTSTHTALCSCRQLGRKEGLDSMVTTIVGLFGFSLRPDC